MVHIDLISVFVVNEFLLVVFVIELLEHDGILTGLHSSWVWFDFDFFNLNNNSNFIDNFIFNCNLNASSNETVIATEIVGLPLLGCSNKFWVNLFETSTTPLTITYHPKTFKKFPDNIHQCNSMQYIAKQCNLIHCHIMQCNAIEYNTINMKMSAIFYSLTVGMQFYACELPMYVCFWGNYQ